MKTVNVKDITIGKDIPKVCIPLTSATLHQLIIDAKQLIVINFDIIEWRVDYFNDADDIESIVIAAKKLREIHPNTPILFTFRSKPEGGQKTITTDYYLQLSETIIETGLIDLIDIELFTDKTVLTRISACAKQHNIKTVISHHDFEKTPQQEEILHILKRMDKEHADLAKIAVMPKNKSDLLMLLSATLMANEQLSCPIITISMGKLGLFSRITGENFGSAMTFAAFQHISAPGQIDVNDLMVILKILHKYQ